jgi:L-seryl-tRNA(Ser) seleniumtransferase
MIEIGTTNKTHLRDFKNAINENTGLIMIAHTSNYKVVGFTESVDVKEIVQIAKKKRIPLFLDLGSGALINYEKYNLPKEKILQKYIRMGVDIISFSGDKLLGGPQSGIICGKKSLINKIHSNSMYRALRCDKLTISLIESTLRTYISENQVNNNNLTFKLLIRSRKELEKIGNSILKILNKKIIKKYNIKLVPSTVQAGSGSLPIENIESMALVFNSQNHKPSEVSKLLRNSSISTIGYIKGNKFYIDLKAIPKDQIKKLINSIEHCLA